ncbi:winged helix-turn-helix transcriptional regulator [Microbispora bryophytorum]|uniref:winged helix-turn-helix transcriptional regulator n=1 Tax=Microbispora bryophytorum TaxID=1460882 RepID=UPI00295F1B40|nr:winged helix-turn-helix transcriptional regulator [Microbispora camponoti]
MADLRHLAWEIVPVRDLTSSLSPRKRREDPAHVRLLAETDRPFDPLLVHRPTMRVIDGVHRLRAAVLRGRSEIAVRFFDGSEADAFVLSVRLNVGHGLPLTLDERKEAARRIITSHPQWSDRGVAESTGLSAKTVAGVRRRLGGSGELQHSRVGRDGRSRPLSSVEGRRSAAALLAANSEISLRELSRKTGLSVGTVRDVRERLDRGQDPIPDRLRAREGSGAGPRSTATSARDGAAPRTGAVRRAGQTRRPRDGSRSRGETRPPGHAAGEAVETASVLRKLARDPSLRATESGRLLLRILLATEVGPAQWKEIAEAIPAHCLPLIRAVVLKRSEELKRLASMVPDGLPG